MASIFITRHIDQTYWQQHLPTGCEVTGQSLIDIRPVPFEMPEADWIFFYSKNGVKHFFERCPAHLTHYQWAAMGPATAEALANYVLEVDFVGDGTPHTTAQQLDAVIPADQKVCYVRARQSRQSVQSHSQHQYITDLVVYDNQPCTDIPSGPYDIVIFTSPLNAKAYLAQHSLQGSKVIAIGPTTAAALREKGYSEVIVAAQPTEAALMESAVELIDSA